jgi:hypothetical protein
MDRKSICLTSGYTLPALPSRLNRYEKGHKGALESPPATANWKAKVEKLGQTAGLIFSGGPWQSCDPPLRSHLCTRLRRAMAYSEGVRERAAWLGAPGRPRGESTLFSLAGRGNLARGRTRLREPTAWLECGKFLFSLRGVGPPRTRRGSFHEANGGDEGVENAWVLPGAGSIAQGLVKGVRVPADQFLRLFDPDRSQITGDRCADVGDCFEDCGQSRTGRLACAHAGISHQGHNGHKGFLIHREISSIGKAKGNLTRRTQRTRRFIP